MSIINAVDIQTQIDRIRAAMDANSQQWNELAGNPGNAGHQAYLHDQNVQLQAQLDALQGTVTTYDPGTGVWTTTQAATYIPQGVKAPTETPVPKVDNTAASNTVTSYPKGSVSPAISQTVSDIDKRKAEYAANTGWDNDPTIRGYQEQDWQIYINTGRWDTPEQVQLHQMAEAARKAINPAYKGSPVGPIDKAAADATILPDTTPVANSVTQAIADAFRSVATNTTPGGASLSGSVIGIGAAGLFLFAIVSLFRR